MNQQIRDAQDSLNDELARVGATLDGLTVSPVSITPHIINEAKYFALAKHSELVLSALEKIVRNCINQDSIKLLFPELSNYNELLKVVPEYENWIHLARFDFIETGEGEFKLLETNTDCPGGITQKALRQIAFNAAADRVPMIRDALPGRFHPQLIDDPTYFIRTLVKLYQRTKETAVTPSVAVLTSSYRELLNDVSSLATIAQGMGLTSSHVRIQELASVADGIGWDDTKIDIAYQKFDAFIEENGTARWCLNQDEQKKISVYMDGLLNRKFLFVNSVQSALIGENKRTLAFLSCGKFNHLLAQDELHAISSLIPNTYSFSLDNLDSHLLNDIISNKDKYVIKKVIDTRGRGVTIGRGCDANIWKELVSLTINGPFIIQEYIDHPLVEAFFPRPTVSLEHLHRVVSVFLIGGKAAGFQSRLSKSGVVNTAAGGCLQNTFISP